MTMKSTVHRMGNSIVFIYLVPEGDPVSRAPILFTNANWLTIGSRDLIKTRQNSHDSELA